MRGLSTDCTCVLFFLALRGALRGVPSIVIARRREGVQLDAARERELSIKAQEQRFVDRQQCTGDDTSS